MTPKTIFLTKSKYLTGLECPRYLWMLIHNPDKIREKNIVEEFIIEEGNKVGEIAKRLFPDGKDVPFEDFKSNIEKTKEFLKENKILFEAGFLRDNCSSRMDILVPVGKNEFDIVEVKSSTRVKDVNIFDVAFQKYCCEGNGIRIRKCFLMHTNNQYVRNGEIKPAELLIKEDVTAEVNENIKGIQNRINKILEMMSSDEPPRAGILDVKIIKDGYHDCFMEECVELPDNHVFCLYRGGKLSCGLYNEGIEEIKKIPNHIKLNDKQKIQRDCEVNNKVHVDKKKIREFLDGLEYPLYFLDFETICNKAVPMFNGVNPYQQIPFQFSLHVLKDENSKPEHHEFLYSGNGDPRKEFFSELKKVLEDKGSIIVFNQTFEVSRLKELAEWFPEESEWVDNVLPRIVDLLIPFRDFAYYNPKQQGSASIKDIFPALCGESHKELEISEGGTASVEFYNMTYDNFRGNKEQIRKNLLKYCEMDTLAEVKIIDKLKELVR